MYRVKDTKEYEAKMKEWWAHEKSSLRKFKSEGSETLRVRQELLNDNILISSSQYADNLIQAINEGKKAYVVSSDQ